MYSTKDSGRAFGEMLVTGSTGKIRLSVGTASMRGSFKSVMQHFVLWKSGIDTDSVELVQGDKYTLSYTYGWPSGLPSPDMKRDPAASHCFRQNCLAMNDLAARLCSA